VRKLPPLGSLRAFEAAARHMSFQKAAAELGVTPTAISHQIRLLERICGRALFQRRPRPIALTSAGARLFPIVRDGLDAFAAGVAGVAAERERRPLRVTTTNAFAGLWLVPRLPLWREVHPGVALEVIGTDAVLDLHADEADVAIRYAHSAPPDLVAHELLRDRFFPVCSPALLAAGNPIRHPIDLAQHTLIHFFWSPADSYAPTWQRWLAMARISDPEVPEVDEIGKLNFREELHAIEAVIAGQGIAVCSDVLVARELQSGVLVKALDLSLPGLVFYLVHVPDHPQQWIIEAFAAWLRRVA
jgi:LysR family transcriptional regulator, glycine cleavage system transcriptional activator